MINKESARTVAMRKALMENNEPAMKALRNGEDIASTGIEVGVLEAAGERPLLTVFGLVADAGIAYAGYEGVKAIDDSTGGDEPKNVSTGGDSVTIKGDSNTVNISKAAQPVEP